MSKHLKVEVGELYRVVSLHYAMWSETIDVSTRMVGQSQVEVAFGWDESIITRKFSNDVCYDSNLPVIVGVATRVVPVPIVGYSIGSSYSHPYIDYVELLTDKFGIVYVSCEELEPIDQ